MKNLITIIFLLGVTICAVSAENIPLCKSGITIKCVRDYFAKHGLCLPKRRELHEIKYKGIQPLHLPNIGVDAWTTETTLSPFAGVYKNFEMDPVTGDILFSNDFTETPMNCYAPNTLIIFNENGKEPLVLQDYVNATYAGKITVTIPTRRHGRIDGWSFKNAHYATFFDKGSEIQIGPKITESKEPVVQKALKGLKADLQTALKEIFDDKSSYLFLLWLQSNVCDFKESPVLEKNDMTVINSLKGIQIDQSKLSHPCGDDELTKCTREYFAKKASCSLVKKTSNGPVSRKTYPMTVPVVYADQNMSDVVVNGLDAEVTHMHVNKATENLVIALKTKKLNIKVNKYTGVVKQWATNPKPFDSFTEMTYVDVLVNVVINIKHGLTRKAIENAYVTASTEHPFKVRYGSEITQNKDDDIQSAYKESLESDMIVTREFLSKEAKHFFIDYVQLNICNLGLTL